MTTENFKKVLARKPCPQSGTGCHSALFWAACCAVDGGVPFEEAEPLIEAWMSRPPAPPTEVRDALDAASGERTTAIRWPARSFKLTQAALKTPRPSWVPLDVTAEEAIDILFPGNPLLCVGKGSNIFTTKPRKAWRGRLSFNSLIVPSPMNALLGKTNAGHLSAHSLTNTGPRHYLITEWDWGTADAHLRMIQHLRQFGTLAAVVNSGGKSTHGWWDCRGEDESAVKEFFNYAVTLGADTRLWLRSQFCRMPAGLRGNGNRQDVLFLI